jgi:hypothetical protein
VKGIVIRGRLDWNSVVVQCPPTVLIRQALAELPVGEYFPSEKGLEMKMAEPLPIDGVGTVMHAPQTGKEAAGIDKRSILRCHDSSTGDAVRIMGPFAAVRQGASRFEKSAR